MEYLERVKRVPIEAILQNVWPEGLCLMRDCEWIAYWESEEEETAYTQDGESFNDFVCRVVADVLENEEPDEQGYYYHSVDFAIAEAEYINSTGRCYQCCTNEISEDYAPCCSQICWHKRFETAEQPANPILHH